MDEKKRTVLQAKEKNMKKAPKKTIIEQFIQRPTSSFDSSKRR